MTVQELMTTRVETLDPSDDVDLADMVMRLDRLHHLPVVSDGQLVGLVSQRDIARHQVSPSSGLSLEAQRRANLRVKVRDMMVTDVATVPPGTSVLEAAELMRERYLGCLPVVDDGELVGIVTGTDMLGLLIQELEA
jgi:CBS domain-containing protein